MSDQSRMLIALLFLISAFAPVHAENQISTRQIGENDYELTFESATVFDVEAATKLLIPTMRSICGKRGVEAGRYTFDSTKPITSAGSGEPDPSAFKLVQQIRCVDRPASSRPIREPILTDADALQDVESRVCELSKRYFQSHYARLGDDAYTALSPIAREGLDRSEPQPTAPGVAVEINIHKITIYDNIPSAPAAGVYVAADYQNSVGNIAFHCGYLMWFSKDGKEFSLGRVESGVINEEILAAIPVDDLPAVLSEMRCSMK